MTCSASLEKLLLRRAPEPQFVEVRGSVVHKAGGYPQAGLGPTPMCQSLPHSGAMNRATADVVRTQGGVITRSQALQGYTPEQIRARLAGGRWVRVFRGVYRAAAAEPTARLRVVAAGLSIGTPATACLHTAAELPGFGVLESDTTHVIAEGMHLRQAGLVVHSAALRPADRCRTSGVAATMPSRTAIDCARTAPRADALALLDASLRTGLVAPPVLCTQLDLQSGARGIVAARELVALADGRAESPMESRSRLRCLDGGLPSPELQIEVRSGRRRYRIDLGWRRQKVGLEYDSLAFHGDHATLRYDRERHNWLTAQGWTMVYATARQILSVPDELIAQLAYALGVTR